MLHTSGGAQAEKCILVDFSIARSAQADYILLYTRRVHIGAKFHPPPPPPPEGKEKYTSRQVENTNENVFTRL